MERRLIQASYSYFSPMRRILLEDAGLVPRGDAKVSCQGSEAVLRQARQVIDNAMRIIKKYNSFMRTKGTNFIEMAMELKNSSVPLKKTCAELNATVKQLHSSCWDVEALPPLKGWDVSTKQLPLMEMDPKLINKIGSLALKGFGAFLSSYNQRNFKVLTDSYKMTVRVIPVNGLSESLVIVGNGKKQSNKYVSLSVFLDPRASLMEVGAAVATALFSTVHGKRKHWDEKIAREAMDTLFEISNEVAETAPRALGNMAISKIKQSGSGISTVQRSLSAVAKELEVDKVELFGELLAYSLSRLSELVSTVKYGKFEHHHLFVLLHYFPPLGRA